MLEITVSPLSLSAEQRKAVAAFILNFNQDPEEVSIPAFTIPSEEQPEPIVYGAGLDAAGLPWDERIHASSKVRTSDGLWRRKRGVEDATVEQVKGELKAVMAIPAPAPAPAPVVEPPAPAFTAPEPAPTPVAPEPAPIPTFVDLIKLASAAVGAKQITQEQLNAAVNAAGVPSLPMLGNRLDLVPQVMDTIKAYIAASAGGAL